jgi:hypothetical protein
MVESHEASLHVAGVVRVVGGSALGERKRFRLQSVVEH